MTIDRHGERRGMMTALTPTHVKLSSGRNMSAWLCRCDCGIEKTVMTVNWVKGKHHSCGCNRSAAQSARHARHGKNPLYRVWTQMRQRCHETYATNHKWYGARGITVCDRWRFGEDGKSGFECFLEDMGPRPDGLTLDRIDVNGNYEPGNCRWATWQEQANNKQARAATAIPLREAENLSYLQGCGPVGTWVSPNLAHMSQDLKRAQRQICAELLKLEKRGFIVIERLTAKERHFKVIIRLETPGVEIIDYGEITSQAKEKQRAKALEREEKKRRLNWRPLVRYAGSPRRGKKVYIVESVNV